MRNLKITQPEDLALAAALLREEESIMRIGHGFDAHRLVEGRRLILGGQEIPYHLGLDGHSDADVLVHALMDALLGALGEGDIGATSRTATSSTGARTAVSCWRG